MSPEAIEDFRRDYRDFRADAGHSFAARVALQSLVALAVEVPELQAVIEEEKRWQGTSVTDSGGITAKHAAGYPKRERDQ